MTRSEFLKQAFEEGYAQAMQEAGIEKQALWPWQAAKSLGGHFLAASGFGKATPAIDRVTGWMGKGLQKIPGIAAKGATDAERLLQGKRVAQDVLSSATIGSLFGLAGSEEGERLKGMGLGALTGGAGGLGWGLGRQWIGRGAGAYASSPWAAKHTPRFAKSIQEMQNVGRLGGAGTAKMDPKYHWRNLFGVGGKDAPTFAAGERGPMMAAKALSVPAFMGTMWLSGQASQMAGKPFEGRPQEYGHYGTYPTEQEPMPQPRMEQMV